MVFLSLDDPTGSAEVVVFHTAVRNRARLLP